MDYLTLGSTPSGENCICVTRDSDYAPAMRHECRVFAQMLQRLFPQYQGRFRVKSCPHDFGTYYEVVLLVKEDSDWSFENDIPEYWDKKARYDLLENEQYREEFEHQRNPKGHQSFTK